MIDCDTREEIKGLIREVIREELSLSGIDRGTYTELSLDLTRYDELCNKTVETLGDCIFLDKP